MAKCQAVAGVRHGWLVWAWRRWQCGGHVPAWWRLPGGPLSALSAGAVVAVAAALIAPSARATRLSLLLGWHATALWPPLPAAAARMLALRAAAPAIAHAKVGAHVVLPV